MINLLPDQTKQDYRYAQRNVHLQRWVIAAALSFFIVGLVGSYGWLSIRRSIKASNAEITSIEDHLKVAKLTETNKQVVEISNSITLAQRVLSQEILFSKLLKQMATALPNGTYLSGLNISDVAGGSALDISVNASNYKTATQVQLNLADPSNQIFAKADIQNISCDATNAQDPDYPCKITLRAQFASNNQFLFINQGKAGS